MRTGKSVAALREFGAPLAKMTEADFCDRNSFFIIGVAPDRVDILQHIPGLEFEATWAKRRSLDLEGLQVSIPSLDDMIAAKIAAGRPQDLLDVTKLRKALELEQRRDEERGRDGPERALAPTATRQPEQSRQHNHDREHEPER